MPAKIMMTIGILLACIGFKEGGQYGMFEAVFLCGIGIGLFLGGLWGKLSPNNNKGIRNGHEKRQS